MSTSSSMRGKAALPARAGRADKGAAAFGSSAPVPAGPAGTDQHLLLCMALDGAPRPPALAKGPQRARPGSAREPACLAPEEVGLARVLAHELRGGVAAHEPVGQLAGDNVRPVIRVLLPGDDRAEGLPRRRSRPTERAAGPLRGPDVHPARRRQELLADQIHGIVDREARPSDLQSPEALHVLDVLL